MIGIYKITNTINDKCYIGQSANLLNRIHKHIKTLTNVTNANEHLQNAYNKYGTGNFTIEIIEECTEEELDEREIYWIEFYNSCDKNFGYNKTPGGKGGNGYFEVLEQKEKNEILNKLSKAKIGELNPLYGLHCYTDGYVIKYINTSEIEQYELNGWRPGVPDFVREKERIANIGERNGFYGKHHSEETKQRLSETRSGEKNWNYGKVLYHKDNKQKYIEVSEIEYYQSIGWTSGPTDQSKNKISQSNTGKKKSESTLRKHSIIYVYKNNEYIGWRKLQSYLKANGYPKISETAIIKLANGKKS